MADLSMSFPDGFKATVVPREPFFRFTAPNGAICEVVVPRRLPIWPMTAEERPFLTLFTEDLALLTEDFAKRPSGDIEVYFRIRAKGFVEADRGMWRITPAGRLALARGEGDK